MIQDIIGENDQKTLPTFGHIHSLFLTILCTFLRWAFNDDNLPSWFVEDETKHYQRQIPVTKEIVEEYRAKMKEINSRSVKKIAEAKARKKRKVWIY